MYVFFSVPLEMSAFAKERTNGWYSVHSYFVANLIAGIPLQFLCPMLYIGIMYFLTGQVFDWNRIVIIFSTFILLSLTAQSHGVMVGAIFMRSVVTAVFVAPMTVVPLMLFSGFFLKIQNIPNYLHPITLISYLRYVFENVLVALYGYDRCGEDSVDIIELTKQRLQMFLSNVFRIALSDDDYDDDENGSNVTNVQETAFNVKNLTKSLVSGITAQLGGATEVVDGKKTFGVLALFKLSESVIIPNLISLTFFFVLFRSFTYAIIYVKGTTKKG